LGVRFNGVYRNGDTPVDRESRELGLAVVGLDFRGERVRLSGDFGHTDNDIYEGPLHVQVAAAAPVPRVPDASRNYVQPWVSYKLEDTFGALRGEFDLSPDVLLYAGVGQRRSNEVSILASPTVTNAAGTYTAGRTNIGNYEERLSGEVGARSRFRTGAIGHQLSIAATTLHTESGFFFNTNPSLVSNLYDPVFVAPPNFNGFSRNRPRRNESDLSSIGVADTLSFLGDRVELTLGARHQQVKVEAYAATGAQTSSYDEDAVTPAVGLVVKPRENVSVYGNYIEGLTQGPTAPLAAANAGTVFAPFKSKQYETGVKVDFGRVATTLSAFQITQPSALTDPTTNVFGLDGEQRNRGLELNVFGEPYRGIRVLGGVTFIDGELTSTAGGANDGNTPVGVPDMQVNLGGEWDLVWVPGATLTGRVIHTSSQYLTPTNTKSIPDWTRFDIGARYATRMGGRPVTFRATVENLFDKSYWASAAAGYLSIGAPRTVLLSATVDF
jgi:iron complex outermembrane receptor protein